ncbi:class I adenylate-forming enzyme family protein [Streptantibioticus cattleyicolor]|uniref:class I adenylate-forming enzyme family protein n=1 Tax=Streptantibioticus cattleyicolor TaxID=29303 RepID=UPI000213DE12|nr:class I adenylate-forming enzyme family protein [Streptantibioticus cattleyicolor]CCB72235.1 Coronafacic acid synthetase, ligase component [Streptantibioticus cattleyicolor NRRL 8057 = DSM 46488]
MSTTRCVTPVPTEERAAEYLDTLVRVDGQGPVRRPRFAEVRRALAASGVAEGHAVLICVADAHTRLTAFLAAHYLGLVPALLPPGWAEHRLRPVCDALGAAAVVCAGPGPSGVTVRRSGTPRLQPYEAGQAVLLTSGTSGPAGGCLHRVASLFVNARRHAAAIGLRPTDTVLVSLPLHYSFALVAQALAGVATGARLVLGGPPFTPAGYLDSLTRHDVTVSSLSPSLVRALLGEDRRPPRSLRVLTVGGDVLEATRVRELRRRHPEGELYLTYGLTEAGPRVSTLAVHREPESRYTSVGRPLPGVVTTVRDVAPDGSGELLVTTGTAMVRRVGHPGTARRDLVGPHTVATGDVFRRDPEGFLFFCGRLSDFVVAGGDRLSLRWVRELVGALPGVLHVRTELVRGPLGRGGLVRQRYRLHVVARDVTPRLRELVRRRLKEVLLRVEFPCDVVFSEQNAAEFAK